MNYRIIFHRRADTEYSDAYMWYEERLAGLGIRFSEAVEKCIRMIKSNPDSFAKKKGNYREIMVEGFPFQVVYVVRKKENIVFISAIFHTSRNPKKKHRRFS